MQLHASSQKTFTLEGLVLRRVNTGESDRIVTLVTQEAGKFVCIAKGVRKLTSSRGSALEPGNHISGHFVKTKSLPILTQLTLISDTSPMTPSLARHRQLSLVLELFDRIFVEEELEPGVYELALQLRNAVIQNRATTSNLKQGFSQIITRLGYQSPGESKYASISEYVSALSDRKIRSFEFLSVQE